MEKYLFTTDLQKFIQSFRYDEERFGDLNLGKKMCSDLQRCMKDTKPSDWVFMWRSFYSVLTKVIQISKLHRKTKFLEKNYKHLWAVPEDQVKYVPSSTNSQYISSCRKSECHSLSEIATRMLEVRQEAKELYHGK